MRVRLDIDTIPDSLYESLLNEFRKQHGDANYTEWELTTRELINRELERLQYCLEQETKQFNHHNDKMQQHQAEMDKIELAISALKIDLDEE